MIVVGTGAGADAELSLRVMMGKRASLMGTMLRARAMDEKAAAVQAFARDHGLTKNFVFLVGGAAQLQAVWSAYGIRIETDPTTTAVGHSDAIYLLDKKGQARVLTHSDITADALAGDLKLLAAEH